MRVSRPRGHSSRGSTRVIGLNLSPCQFLARAKSQALRVIRLWFRPETSPSRRATSRLFVYFFFSRHLYIAMHGKTTTPAT